EAAPKPPPKCKSSSEFDITPRLRRRGPCGGAPLNCQNRYYKPKNHLFRWANFLHFQHYIPQYKEK
ncbi:MAG TPA: hypothetical protein PKK15_14425, partial [Kouleothrix sp.]|nr:hypothetical protein [Kouleothrix sp.]